MTGRTQVAKRTKRKPLPPRGSIKVQHEGPCPCGGRFAEGPVLGPGRRPGRLAAVHSAPYCEEYERVMRGETSGGDYVNWALAASGSGGPCPCGGSYAFGPNGRLPGTLTAKHSRPACGRFERMRGTSDGQEAHRFHRWASARVGPS